MPPHTSLSSARLLYAFTALVAVSIIATVGFAGAGQEEAQCKGNSPKKICPDVLPADGATVSGTVKVSATVEDAVSSISFEVDNVAIAPPERVASYEVMWDTTKSSNGAHVLEVTTTDATGKNSVLDHRIDVSNPTAPPPPPPGDTTAPTVGLTSPASGATVSGAVSVAASASDDVGVVGVQFKVDGANVGAEDTTAPYSVSWSSGNVANGSHTVTAVARDAAGNSANSQRSVNVSNTTSTPPPTGDTTAPTVGLTSPASGATVSGAVSVAASASDNVAVVGVQFKIDGGNLGAEDTTAPYSVSWSSDNVANGTHAVTAVARDAAGNSSSSQRSVTVSNTTSSGDTTAPTVGLTSPASGSTVTGSVSVAASASDNVAVVGVQFKIDGGNLGTEDTTAPYSVSWSSANVSNGGHNVTAVARDAAGNTSTSQRTVTVSNSTGGSTGPTLSWAPPALSNAVTINVTNANRRLFLDNSRDYRLNITETLHKELWIEGGRNVVVVGGHITVDALGSDNSYQDNTAVKVRFGDPSGTVHLEGLLIDGPYVADGIGVATGRNVQIENVRVERVYEIKGAHPDCIQIQQGVGALRVDGFTCKTALQGIFLGDHDGPIRSADLRHVNMYGTQGKYMFFQTNPTYPVALSDFWLAIGSGYTQWASFGYWVYPQENGQTWDGKSDLTRRSQVSSDGTYLTFVGSSNTITGRINKGVPSGGDFVSASAVGAGYSSPGY